MPLFLLTAALLAGTPATASPPGGEHVTHALVVGSNRGGEGQAELRFAESDARRVAKVLAEIGRVPARNVRLLLAPQRDDLLQVIHEVGQRLELDAQVGRQSQVIFYYSGHARADALNLGSELLELDVLRGELQSLPTTVTLALFDACQSGAISGVKGAEPARDFSYNSVDRLNTTGFAVMSSSTANELSQESGELGSSFFTHHLIAALRGAGDQDQNGRVTLSEAYRYTHDATLVATAETAVGSQHATLETDLRGKGELVVAYPAEASAQLVLPEALEAEVVVFRANTKAVVAELQKAPGSSLRLALPPSRFRALVRRGEEVLGCEFDLDRRAVHELDTADCSPVAVGEGQVKGDAMAAAGSDLPLLVDFKRGRTDPLLALALGAQPYLPVAVGHIFLGEWDRVALFTALKLAGIGGLLAVDVIGGVVIAFALFDTISRRPELVQDQQAIATMMFGLVGPFVAGLTGSYLLYSGGLLAWEAFDAYSLAEQRNQELQGRILEEAGRVSSEPSVATAKTVATGRSSAGGATP